MGAKFQKKKTVILHILDPLLLGREIDEDIVNEVNALPHRSKQNS